MALGATAYRLLADSCSWYCCSSLIGRIELATMNTRCRGSPFCAQAQRLERVSVVTSRRERKGRGTHSLGVVLGLALGSTTRIEHDALDALVFLAALSPYGAHGARMSGREGAAAALLFLVAAALLLLCGLRGDRANVPPRNATTTITASTAAFIFCTRCELRLTSWECCHGLYTARWHEHVQCCGDGPRSTLESLARSITPTLLGCLLLLAFHR